MLLKSEKSILVSSDPSQGAVNRSTDGSAFEIQLDTALQIPSDAMNITIRSEESTVWWTVPNIITGENNKFYIFGDNKIGGAELFIVSIQQGLYDLTTLNISLQSELEKAGARTKDVNNEPLPLVSLSPDNATQKVLLRFNYPNVTVNFAQPDTPREILGFNSELYGPFPAAPLNVTAPNTAAFNRVNYFLIASDLVQKGIRFNNRYNQVISQVLIDVSPGSQIVSTPFNPAKSEADELAGASRSNLRFRLTDDKLRPVNTAGEYWSTRLVVEYYRPFLVKADFVK